MDIQSILAMLQGGGVGLLNGAKAFGEQAKWTAGQYGNAPMPAPYTGGPQYPAPDDANAYVRSNWPDGGQGVTDPSQMADVLRRILEARK